MYDDTWASRLELGFYVCFAVFHLTTLSSLEGEFWC